MQHLNKELRYCQLWTTRVFDLSFYFASNILLDTTHVFGDTSGTGTVAAVYALVHQTFSTNHGLVTAKAHLAKKMLTVDR